MWNNKINGKRIGIILIFVLLILIFGGLVAYFSNLKLMNDNYLLKNNNLKYSVKEINLYNRALESKLYEQKLDSKYFESKIIELQYDQLSKYYEDLQLRHEQLNSKFDLLLSFLGIILAFFSAVLGYFAFIGYDSKKELNLKKADFDDLRGQYEEFSKAKALLDEEFKQAIKKYNEQEMAYQKIIEDSKKISKLISDLVVNLKNEKNGSLDVESIEETLLALDELSRDEDRIDTLYTNDVNALVSGINITLENDKNDSGIANISHVDKICKDINTTEGLEEEEDSEELEGIEKTIE